VYIAVRWTMSALEQIPMLVGKTADPSFLNQLTYLAGTHDPRILKVDTILAYHMGLKYQCEVHIVVPEDMSLKEAHDIGESLETKIERLDCVEMAFVHLDYEFEHKPEHVSTQHTANTCITAQR
jgi:divalent metal cation (Fe/Co/Zn/Cd) transporter